MSRRFQRHRRMRHELFSLAVAFAVPVVLVAVFPHDALRPLPPSPENPSATSFSFVTLSPEQESKAVASARTAWQRERGEASRMRIDLLADPLPPLRPRPILDALAPMGAGCAAAEPYAPDPLPPTLAAPPPEKIAPQPDTDKVAPTFSREELLKLN